MDAFGEGSVGMSILTISAWRVFICSLINWSLSLDFLLGVFGYGGAGELFDLISAGWLNSGSASSKL